MTCSLATPRAVRWIQKGKPAFVLNLFAGACNLANDEGDVISLVTSSIGAGPFTLIIDGDCAPYMDAQSAVVIEPGAGSLTVGDFRTSIQQTPIWDPRPAWHLLQSGSFALPITPPATVEELNEPLQKLLSGIERGSRVSCQAAVSRLAGLGQGLTPSGDDLLMGILYGLWTWYPEPEWLRLIVETAVPRTTTLSGAFLRAAGDGEATVHWHNLVNGVPGAVEQILTIGHTSGQEAWAGFVHFAHRFSP